MKLSKQELQFIETYLKNSDVKYLDIRMELTDHIASAVEEKMQSENLDFYDAFKEYMVVNKKELLKQNRYSFKKSIQDFCRGFLNPLTFLFLVISGISLYYLQPLFDNNNYHETAKILTLVYLVLGWLIISLLGIRRNTFSETGNIGMTFFWVYILGFNPLGIVIILLKLPFLGSIVFGLSVVQITSVLVYFRMVIELNKKTQKTILS